MVETGFELVILLLGYENCIKIKHQQPKNNHYEESPTCHKACNHGKDIELNYIYDMGVFLATVTTPALSINHHHNINTDDTGSTYVCHMR